MRELQRRQRTKIQPLRKVVIRFRTGLKFYFQSCYKSRSDVLQIDYKP